MKKLAVAIAMLIVSASASFAECQTGCVFFIKAMSDDDLRPMNMSVAGLKAANESVQFVKGSDGQLLAPAGVDLRPNYGASVTG